MSQEKAQDWLPEISGKTQFDKTSQPGVVLSLENGILLKRIKNNTSRMTGDCHVGFCERLGGETHPCLLGGCLEIKEKLIIMKLVNRKSMFFYIMCIGFIFINSCAQTPPYEEELKIIVTPHKLSVCSGLEDKLFVKLLDKQGGTLFGIEVKATSTSPTVATITPEALTDAAGKAVFTVKGISPGTSTIILSVAGQKATMEVIFIEH